VTPRLRAFVQRARDRRANVRTPSRLHRMHAMHDMQPTVTDDRGVCLTVCHGGSTLLHCAETAERTKMLFGVNTLGSPRDIVLHGSPYFLTDRGRGNVLLNFGTSLVSPERL